MRASPTSSAIALYLGIAVVIWGANNAALKQLATHWPPFTMGSTRFLGAGWILVLAFHLGWCPGRARIENPTVRKKLWLGPGLTLAIYMVACNVCLKHISASHFALDMALAPLWALGFEFVRRETIPGFRVIVAPLIALGGVLVLLWPAITGIGHLVGELIGLGSGLLWTLYSRQSRSLSTDLSGLESTAHGMWRAGVIAMPLALGEFANGQYLKLTFELVMLQLYCTLAGGCLAYALWNQALTYWPSSRALLFANLIPITTIAFSHWTLGDPITPSFLWALALILAGVFLGTPPSKPTAAQPT